MNKNGIVQSMALLAVCGYFVGTAVNARTLEQTLEANRTGAAMNRQGFYCNTKALHPEERARHEALTKKLLAKRQETIETDKGYELQYNSTEVSVGEVAEWVVAESKCCPFFDFHIDLEMEGKQVCLRLTGPEGVKQFIRSEFGLK